MKPTLALLFLLAIGGCSRDRTHYYIVQDYNGPIIGVSTRESYLIGDSIELTNCNCHKGMVLGEVYGNAAIDTILQKTRTQKE